jgi:hypothetical protein
LIFGKESKEERKIFSVIDAGIIELLCAKIT